MSTIDLTQGDEQKLLIKTTIPTLWALLASIGMSLTDTFFAGRLGADELTAIGFTFPVVMAVMSLPFGIGVGASSLVSRSIGNRDPNKTRIYATLSLFATLPASVFTAIAGISSINPVFRLLGAPEHLLPLIHEYMSVWYAGAPAVFMLMVGNAVIRAAGQVVWPVRIIVVAAGANLILDPIFIFGCPGFPPMGLKGAALATILASLIALCAGLFVLIKKLKLVYPAHCFSNLRNHGPKIAKVALPAGVAHLISPLGMAISTRLVAGVGSEAVAGFSIAIRIESFALLVIVALAGIMTSFSGQNWGANRGDRIVRGLKAAFRFSTLWSAAIAVCLWLSAEQLAGLFSEQSEIVQAARLYLVMIPITYVFLSAVMLIGGTANGIGFAKPALLMSMSRLFLLYLPFALLLSEIFGLQGLYGATAISNTIVGVYAFAWARRKMKDYQ